MLFRSQQESADKAAAIAKERVRKSVFTILDKSSNLFKVLIGPFTTKEDARRLRDDLAEKHGADYNDAWVTEIDQQ